MNSISCERPDVLLISKPECLLCDEAREMLEIVAAEQGLSVGEIYLDEDPDFEEKYRLAVPVVRANGMTLLSGRFDRATLGSELRRAFSRDPWREIAPEEVVFLPLLECPVCGGELESRPRAVACLRCGNEYFRHQGVPYLVTSEPHTRQLKLMDWLGHILSFNLHTKAEGE